VLTGAAETGTHLQPPGAVISWGGRSLTIEKYEVLVGNPQAIRSVTRYAVAFSAC
jgi:hypothetical protein